MTALLLAGCSVVAFQTGLYSSHRGWCQRAAPTAVATFEPVLDGFAALSCSISLAPIVLAAHWATELNEGVPSHTRRRACPVVHVLERTLTCCPCAFTAKDQHNEAKAVYKQQRVRLLRGDGCAEAYELSKETLRGAHQRLRSRLEFRVCGASATLLEQLSGQLQAQEEQDAI